MKNNKFLKNKKIHIMDFIKMNQYFAANQNGEQISKVYGGM